MKLINKKYSSRRYQKGLSLLELMISMLIGLFLLAGLVTSFISTQDTDRKRLAVSEMDANANAAFDVMRKTITHAGYASKDPISNKQGFYTENDGTIASATCRNGSLRESDAVRAAIELLPTADNGNGDTITIISLADNPCLSGETSCLDEDDVNPKALVYYDCLGGGKSRGVDTVSCSTDPDVGMIDRSEAKIFSSFTFDSTDKELVCTGSRSALTPEENLTIIDNVEAVQYLYGIKETDDSVTFKNADEVNDDWNKVRSVQVAILMRSSDLNLLEEDSTKTSYSLLDEEVGIATADLRRLFRVYTTTINLENMN